MTANLRNATAEGVTGLESALRKLVERSQTDRSLLQNAIEDTNKILDKGAKNYSPSITKQPPPAPLGGFDLGEKNIRSLFEHFPVGQEKLDHFTQFPRVGLENFSEAQPNTQHGVKENLSIQFFQASKAPGSHDFLADLHAAEKGDKIFVVGSDLPAINDTYIGKQISALTDRVPDSHVGDLGDSEFLRQAGGGSLIVVGHGYTSGHFSIGHESRNKEDVVKHEMSDFLSELRSLYGEKNGPEKIIFATCSGYTRRNEELNTAIQAASDYLDSSIILFDSGIEINADKNSLSYGHVHREIPNTLSGITKAVEFTPGSFEPARTFKVGNGSRKAN